MVVAEIGSKAEIRYLENLQRPIRFGRDVFTGGRISASSTREALKILKDFRTVAETYGVKKIHAVATSAVREAANRDNFVDQVYVRTGIEIEILDGSEENRLQLIAVESALEGKFDLEKKNCLIAEVGSGSTELIILSQGQVELTRTLSLGAMRFPEGVTPGKTEPAVMRQVLKRNVHEISVYAAREYNLGQIDTFVALGSDMRLVSQQLITEQNPSFATFTKKAFMEFIAKIGKMTPEDIVTQFGVPYSQAELLYPSLLVYANFMGETAAETVIVPMVSMRDGLLLELAQMFSDYKRTDLSKQVINSAKHLGTKYQYDRSHALCVTALALKLFDTLREDHGMGPKERLLLEVSGVLHDIGTFISPAAHHKHSSYLVNAAEIFGLRRSEKEIVSNVVRYHRRSIPKPTHIPYMSLPKSDRSVVSKLAAILRVADALDHEHQQKIRNFSLEVLNDAYILWIPEEVGDISMERESLREKGDMFAEVFGSPVQLRVGKPSR